MDASYPFGDVLAVGMDHWLPAQTLQGAIDWIAAQGGLPVLASPLSRAKPEPLATVLGLHRLYGLEVYDARLALDNAAEADATALWDRLLSAGNRVFALAGDDATGLSDPAIGAAWIDVLAPASDLESLLSSLRLQRRRLYDLDGERAHDQRAGRRRIQPTLHRPRRPPAESGQRPRRVIPGQR